MKNQVIEVINEEHGKKVIEYWESKGVSTRGMDGINTKNRENTFRYYGVIGGYFSCYSISFIKEANAEIIELPKEEKIFHRVMLVSNDECKWHKRVVFMKKCDRYLAWNKAETIEESESICGQTAWRYAKELTEKVELTKSETAEKFGISEDQLVVKDD